MFVSHCLTEFYDGRVVPRPSDETATEIKQYAWMLRHAVIREINVKAESLSVFSAKSYVFECCAKQKFATNRQMINAVIFFIIT